MSSVFPGVLKLEKRLRVKGLGHPLEWRRGGGQEGSLGKVRTSRQRRVLRLLALALAGLRA